jgi:hypothetical protein
MVSSNGQIFMQAPALYTPQSKTYKEVRWKPLLPKPLHQTLRWPPLQRPWVQAKKVLPEEKKHEEL